MDNKIVFILALIFLCLPLFAMPLFAKDPTRPQVLTSRQETQKVNVSVKVEQPLTAIFIKNKKRFAMIEGKIYQIGEYYRESRIVNIEQDKVLLSSSQGNFHLTLIPNIKK